MDKRSDAQDDFYERDIEDCNGSYPDYCRTITVKGIYLAIEKKVSICLIQPCEVL